MNNDNLECCIAFVDYECTTAIELVLTGTCTARVSSSKVVVLVGT